jgi:hypothetical protein
MYWSDKSEIELTADAVVFFLSLSLSLSLLRYDDCAYVYVRAACMLLLSALSKKEKREE